MTPSESVVRVDFNNVKPGLMLCIGLSRLPQPHGIDIAEKRLLRDSDGTSCWATIVALNETFATFRLDMTTWRDPE